MGMGVDIPRVLIADGDASLRQQLFSALLSFDVFSDGVGTTAEALTRLGEERYGVVVVDVGLRGGDADRVIAYIAGMPLAQRPVVLVLAANPETTRSLDVEIVQIVLRKPLNLPQLVDVVRSCVRSSQKRPIPSSAERGDAIQS